MTRSSDTSFTPGPWKACRDCKCTCGLVWSADGEIHVASVIGSADVGQIWCASDVQISEDERLANARLITAAPEIAEAAVPFIEIAATGFKGSMYEGGPDEMSVLYNHASGKQVTLGDFRRLAAAYAKATGASR